LARSSIDQDAEIAVSFLVGGEEVAASDEEDDGVEVVSVKEGGKKRKGPPDAESDDTDTDESMPSRRSRGRKARKEPSFDKPDSDDEVTRSGRKATPAKQSTRSQKRSSSSQPAARLPPVKETSLQRLKRRRYNKEKRHVESAARFAHLEGLDEEEEEEGGGIPPSTRRRPNTATSESVIKNAQWQQHKSGGKSYGVPGNTWYLEKGTEDALFFKFGKSEDADNRAKVSQVHQAKNCFFKFIPVGRWFRSRDELNRLEIFMLMVGWALGWKNDVNGEKVEREHFRHSKENEDTILDVLRQVLEDKNAEVKVGDTYITMDESSKYHYKNHDMWEEFKLERWGTAVISDATTLEDILKWEWKETMARIRSYKLDNDGKLPKDNYLGLWLRTVARPAWRENKLTAEQVQELRDLDVRLVGGNVAKKSLEDRMAVYEEWLEAQPARDDDTPPPLPSTRKGMSTEMKDFATFIATSKRCFEYNNNTLLPNANAKALDDKGLLPPVMHYFCICDELHDASEDTSPGIWVKCDECRKWYAVLPQCVECDNKDEVGEKDFTCDICQLPESDRTLARWKLVAKEDIAQGRKHVLSRKHYRKINILRCEYDVDGITSWPSAKIHKMLGEKTLTDTRL